DLLEDFEPRIDRDEENKPIRVWLSAQTGAGIPQLFQALTERLSGEVAQHTLRLPPQEGRLRSPPLKLVLPFPFTSLLAINATPKAPITPKLSGINNSSPNSISKAFLIPSLAATPP